jgi:hypothetical protein
MEQILIDAAIQALALWAAYKWGQHVMALRITRMLIDDDPKLQATIERARKEIQLSEEASREKPEDLAVERHGDQLYVYTKTDNEFLAQGSTLEEALDRIAERFPERNFRGLLSKEQADTLGISK